MLITTRYCVFSTKYDIQAEVGAIELTLPFELTGSFNRIAKGMDADTVIAVGSLVHDLLGLVGGIMLCYYGYRLMMRRIKAYPADGKWNWRAAKILFKNTAPGTIFALLGAIAIWLTAAKGLRSDGSRSLADHSLANEWVTSATNDDRPLSMTLGAGAPEASRNSQGSFPENNSGSDPAVTAGSATVIAASPKIVPAKKSGDVTFAVRETATISRQESELRLNAGARTGYRNLEKERRAAERKRSRLEAMYQEGTISSEAYKSGKDAYRIAIQRYRNQVNAARVDEN